MLLTGIGVNPGLNLVMENTVTNIRFVETGIVKQISQQIQHDDE